MAVWAARRITDEIAIRRRPLRPTDELLRLRDYRDWIQAIYDWLTEDDSSPTQYERIIGRAQQHLAHMPSGALPVTQSVVDSATSTYVEGPAVRLPPEIAPGSKAEADAMIAELAAYLKRTNKRIARPEKNPQAIGGIFGAV